VSLSWERVQEIAGTDSIGRPHIAQAMLGKRYIASLREAFDRIQATLDFTDLLMSNGPRYAGRCYRSDPQSKRLACASPPFHSREPEKMIANLKEHGLVGIEVYYGFYSRAEVTHLRSFAQKYSLLATGGSDFHGLDEKTGGSFGPDWPAIRAAKAFLAFADRRPKAS